MSRLTSIALVLALASCGGAEPPRTDRDAARAPEGDAGGGLSPALAYCNCMLISCHEPFHARWGETDEEAIAACQAEAGALGDALACRHAECESARPDDPSGCAAALGAPPCE